MYQIRFALILSVCFACSFIACKSDAPAPLPEETEETETAAVSDSTITEPQTPASPYDTVDVPEGFVIVTGRNTNENAPPMPKHADSSKREGISIPIPRESRSRTGSAIRREQPVSSQPLVVESTRKTEVIALSDRVIRQLESKGIKLDAEQKASIKQLAGAADNNNITDVAERRATRDQLLEAIKNDVLRPDQRALLD